MPLKPATNSPSPSAYTASGGAAISPPKHSGVDADERTKSSAVSGPSLAVTSPIAENKGDQVDRMRRSRLERHRESCRRSYKKKHTTISALKNELQAVEATYNRLVTEHQAQDTTVTESTEQSRLLQSYTALARVKRDLVRENEELYRLNASHMTVEGRLQQILDVDAPPPIGTVPLSCLPLDAQVCAAILTTTRDDILRFAHSPNKLSLRASVFGWTDYRQITDNELKFALEKKYPSHSAEDIVLRTWRVVSDEKLCAQLFNPSLEAKLEVLQRINDDTLLMYRTIRAEALNLTARTVFLLSRMRIPEGFLVVFRSIDPQLVGLGLHQDSAGNLLSDVRGVGYDESIVSSASRDRWVEKYAWAIVYEEGPQSCRFHFGGSTMTNVWLKEVLFVALRWERMAIGPTILLQAE